MTQEHKDLLLKDLCARLPYGVICKSVNFKNPTKLVSIDLDGPLHDVYFCTNDDGSMWNDYDEIKPYLFPLSSMTKEQYEEWCNLEAEPLDEILTRNSNGEKMSTLEHHLLVAKSLTDAVNYCYKNHFDIYGLIPMGLANDATDKNIY